MSKSVYSIVLAILLVVCLAPLSAHADVKTGLVGYWPLDGDATDAGGNGHDGTLVGDVRPVPDRYNVADAALSFPGQADAYVDLGDPEQLQITGAMTVTAWVFLNGTNLNSGRIITKQDAAGDGSWGLGIEADSDGVANALTFSVTRGAADVVSVVDAESLPTDQWVHVTGIYEPGLAVEIYVDGFQHAANTVDIPAQQVGDDGTTVSIGALPEGADCGWDGIIDEVRLYDRVVSQVEIWQIMRANVGCSLDPNPSNGATGVPADVTLSWTAGLFARTHDLYLGTVYRDVNDATRTDPRGVLLSQGRTLTKYYVADTDFQYGQTYYWRVDEVNAFDAAFYKGNVWSFTVELYAPALENVVASSSAISNDGQSPANTVNGSGLNGDDEHSVVPEDMWLGVPSSDEPLWIQYQFDSVCKLQQMLVWNYNAPSESTDGFGLKDVRIEYSTNGSEWNVLKDVELAQATGADGYAANNTISLGGISAKFVRLLVQSNWGGAQYGLSEVRFFHVPMRARAPQPADGETGVDVELILGWSAGRQVSSHDVHFSTSAPLVATGAALVGSVTTNQYVLASLDYGASYFWKIDEHDATAGGVWQGDIWTFSTREYTMFDDFESYNDDARRVYEIWKDGYNNGTGAIVGYMEAPFAEKHIVHGGGQSMPFEYYNAEAPFYSEAARFIGTNNNWLGHDADTLHLFVRGEAGNDPGMLYLGLQDTTGHIEVVTHPDPTIVTSTTWQEWVIPYSDLEGVRMSSLDKMILGVGDRDNPTLGGSGRIYIDDIGYGHPVGGSTPVRR